MIRKIYAVLVYVKDLAESQEFYENKLGLKFKFRNGDWVEFDLGETSFAILKQPDEGGRVIPQKTRIMFQVDDIEEMKSRLAEAGAKFVGEIRDEEYGKLLTLEDPNGHWLELFEPTQKYN